MNTFSTADTRPRIGSGVASGTIVERMNTLTASAAGEHHERHERDRVALRQPEHHRGRPEHPDDDQQPPSDPSSQRAHRQQHGDHDRPDARCGAQPPVADVADVETILGDRRQQRHRSTEQHGEQVEGDRPEQHRLTADEPQSLERVVKGGLLLGRRAFLVVAQAEGGDGGRGHREAHRSRGVRRGRGMVVEQSAARRADDEADLPRDRVHRHQAGQAAGRARPVAGSSASPGTRRRGRCRTGPR